MRIGADGGEGELGHVGLGDDHRAAGAQPVHDRRVGIRRLSLLGKNLRAGAGRLAGDVEQILDADDRAVERAERHAVRDAGIGRIGRGAGFRGIDGEAGARAFSLWVGDAGQRLFKPVAAGERFHAKRPRRRTRPSRRRCGPYTDPAIIGEYPCDREK